MWIMWFQSPSLRGSGRFHCPRRRWYGGSRVSIPFIAGQWSLPVSRSARLGGSASFNPLHCGAVVASQGGKMKGACFPHRFNPLHCGAVVASRCRGGTSPDPDWSFNPLHCGAVVASKRPPRRTAGGQGVSIPFIAGQWSLQGGNPLPGNALKSFQSPSLRGSGRFAHVRRMADAGPGGFNPLHCGAVVASSGSWTK